MSEQLSERDELIEILVAHQRQSSQFCLCGWGKLGASHPAHVADAIMAGRQGWPNRPKECADGEHEITEMCWRCGREAHEIIWGG